MLSRIIRFYLCNRNIVVWLSIELDVCCCMKMIVLCLKFESIDWRCHIQTENELIYERLTWETISLILNYYLFRSCHGISRFLLETKRPPNSIMNRLTGIKQHIFKKSITIFNYMLQFPAILQWKNNMQFRVRKIWNSLCLWILFWNFLRIHSNSLKL